MLHTLRPLSVDGDAAALHAVRAACADHDQIDPVSQHRVPPVEEIRAMLAEEAARSRLTGWTAVEAGGQIAGFGQVAPWHEESGHWVYGTRGWVLPGWRGQGVDAAILRWGEEQSRRRAPLEYPGAVFELAATATPSLPAALLTAEGYDYAYTDVEMRLDLPPAADMPDLPLPPGIETRPVLPEHIPLLGASIAEAYRNEFEGGRCLDSHTQQEGQSQWYGSLAAQHSRLWHVAWDGGEIAGQVLPLILDGRAIIDEVSVRPAWRRRGIARALLTRALRDVTRRGVAVAVLDTQLEFRTRAVDLYKSLGFRVIHAFPHYRKMG